MSYHPIVFWGQSKEYILLSVKITNSTNVSINITDENIIFNAKGEGSNGFKEYKFEIKFYLPAISKDSSWKIKENFIEIKVKKELRDPWIRLTYTSLKLPWLKCDFNNFFFDDSDYSSEESNNKLHEIAENSYAINQEQNKNEKYINEFMKPLNLYLLIYNLFQFAGYLYTFVVCLWIYFKHGLHKNYFLFSMIRDQLITVQLTSILEFFHAYLGWVKTSSNAAFMQIFGRNLILFLIIIPHKELQSDDEIYLLLISWSCIEIIRYPYYLLIMLHENISFLTWLRYTIWVPLYPIGFMSEGKLILKSIPYLQESRKFSIYLPNVCNIHFDFLNFLYIYIPLTIIGFYILMKRMYSQRKKKMGPTLNHNWSKYSFLQFLIETLSSRKESNKVTSKGLPLKNLGKLKIK